MVFAAYRGYRTWRDARIKQARKEARDEERARQMREFAARGIILPPEIAAVLAGEPDEDD